MKDFPRILRLAAAACLLVPSISRAEDAYVEGEVLVTFKPTVAEHEVKTALDRHSLGLTRRFERISKQRGRVSGMVRRADRTTRELVADLQTDPRIEAVEPNYLRHVTAVVPNDPNFQRLWGLQNTGQTVDSTAGTSGADIKFVPAWRLARPTTTDEVVVGVVDTGVDISHPDLAANIWTNPGEIPGNGIDDDGDGYVDDVHGYDFAAGTASITDSGEHGTHVAGTIGAVGKNGIGVIGVNYRAKILPLTVSTNGDSISTSAVLDAYDYAIALKQRGVNLVALNASFGGGSSSNAERNGITALRDAGIILCAAAGNEGTNNDATPEYPASYPLSNIIAVAAVGQTDALASFSNRGATSVDIAAPGVNIYSSLPRADLTRTTRLLAGTTGFSAQEITFSGLTDDTGITGTLFACGIGNSADFPAGVAGNVALIERGTLSFSQKVANAVAAGAKAVIIYDNTTASLTTGAWTLSGAGSWPPTLQVTNATGLSLTAGGTVTVRNSVTISQAYQYLDGTSMATPHVTGAVAFAAMNYPADTMAQRMARILNHTTPVASLTGKTVSGGVLNLLGIVDTDGDGLPDWWEAEHFGNLAQTATGDPDGDGFSNLAEFQTGTNPTSPTSHLTLAISKSASSPTLSFSSAADTSYQIEWSKDLKTWSALGTTQTGTGATISVTDSSATGNRFYRLHLLPD